MEFNRACTDLKLVEKTFGEESERLRDLLADQLKKALAEFLGQLNPDLFEELKSQKNANNLEFLNYKGLKDIDQVESSTLNRVIMEGLTRATITQSPRKSTRVCLRSRSNL